MTNSDIVYLCKSEHSLYLNETTVSYILFVSHMSDSYVSHIYVYIHIYNILYMQIIYIYIYIYYR